MEGCVTTVAVCPIDTIGVGSHPSDATAFVISLEYIIIVVLGNAITVGFTLGNVIDM